jgi:hypothetical protein
MRSGIYIATIALNCCVCFGQSLSIGGIGGARITGDVSGLGSTSVSKRYVIGPELDLGLPLGLGIEVDALYRRDGFSDSFYGISDQYANSWEFPLLLKYKLPFPLVKPFLEGGYAPRVIQGFGNSQGLVIGGGVQFGVGRLHVAPAVRYTHWNNNVVLIPFNNGPTIVSTQNQVDILVGVTWGLR